MNVKFPIFFFIAFHLLNKFTSKMVAQRVLEMMAVSPVLKRSANAENKRVKLALVLLFNSTSEDKN